MTRTIIDILNVADQERFHSSMIAWMLSPSGEHGCGYSFGDQLFKNIPSLAGKRVRSVEIEKVSSGARFDIWIEMHDGSITILENKTKSFGGASQLRVYQESQPSATVVALGFDKMNFESNEYNKYPILDYADVLAASVAMLGDPSDHGFDSLLKHYQAFLSRELGRLNCIRKCFNKRGGGQPFIEVEDFETWNTSNKNSKRYYNSFYLAALRDFIMSHDKSGPRWVILKDLQSGVVMYQANPTSDINPTNAVESKYWDVRWLQPHLKQFVTETGNWMLSPWIEIELRDGIFAHEKAWCGEIRLRAGYHKHSGQTAGEMQERFARECQTQGHMIEEPESFPARQAKAAQDTFMLLRKRIRRSDLEFESMLSSVSIWYERHGLKYAIPTT